MPTKIVQVQVNPCLARSTAAFQLDQAESGRAMVSDPCVVRELLALAAERGVTIEFYKRGKRLEKSAA